MWTVSLVFTLQIVLVFGRSSKPTKVCVTSECHQLSKLLRKFINQNASACDDFNTYACGKWNLNNDAFTDVVKAKILNKTVDALLKRSPEGLPKVYELATTFYSACLAYDSASTAAQDEVLA